MDADALQQLVATLVAHASSAAVQNAACGALASFVCHMRDVTDADQSSRTRQRTRMR